MLNTKFSPWPSYTQEEADAVTKVLLSNKVNYWTGDETKHFETEFAEWVQAKYAIALANGTLALELALSALGIGKGDEVIVTARTFLASASCIVNVGATPVFADISADSQNITADTIKAVMTSKTKAVICVHLAGYPCEMDEIMALAEQNKLYVIEDCAQAHGAKYKGQSVGTIGHIAAWSFCQDKIMTTGGEGGMVTTNDRDLWSRVWSLKDHGKSWQSVYEKKHPPGFRWLHDSFGTNARMTEMQAVIGRIQLSRMKEWTKKRYDNLQRVWQSARELALFRVPDLPDYIQHAAYKCYIFVRPELLSAGWTRDRIMHELNQVGIPCYTGSCSEVYLEHAFDSTGHRPTERLPVAKQLGETSLMFLVHPTLSQDEVSRTCIMLKRIGEQALINN